MDWIGDVGLIGAIASLVVSVVGLVVVLVRNADRDGLVRGLQMVYVGMAGTCLGVTLFVLSRPETVLSLPFKIASGALMVGMSARILAHVVTLRRRSQLPPATH
jgi:hypothetical protein